MFNWDEFKNGKVAVWCDTEEKAREFVDECYKNNITWGKGKIKEPKFNVYKENTCYNFEIDLFNSRLMFTEKSYYEEQNYKIIKWESENMKFKVGDKVRVINNGLSFTTHTMANKWLREIKNSKPYNYNNAPKNGSVGFVRDIVKAPSFETPTLILEIENYSYLILMDGVELIESLTEFTFQEVIVRNIPGVYVNKGCERIESVEIDEDGSLTIKADFSGLNELGLGLGVDETIKFKLQEPKKMYVLYEVIHAEKGKEYTFRPKEGYEVVPRDWVVCDTKKGKTFGRVIGSVVKQLTEKEYKQYKECWRA